MNKINLLVMLFVAGAVACNTKTGSNDSNNSSFDINTELSRHSNDAVTYVQSLQEDSIVNQLLINDTTGTSLGASQDGEPYLFLARTKAGFVEIHEQMDDVAIIRSGHGTLKTGHEVTGKINTTNAAPSRNWFCEAIKEATERRLAPGDFVIIPAMTAHQYVPDQGDTLTYWTIKVKRVKAVN